MVALRYAVLQSGKRPKRSAAIQRRGEDGDEDIDGGGDDQWVCLAPESTDPTLFSLVAHLLLSMARGLWDRPDFLRGLNGAAVPFSVVLDDIPRAMGRRLVHSRGVEVFHGKAARAGGTRERMCIQDATGESFSFLFLNGRRKPLRRRCPRGLHLYVICIPAGRAPCAPSVTAVRLLQDPVLPPCASHAMPWDGMPCHAIPSHPIPAGDGSRPVVIDPHLRWQASHRRDPNDPPKPQTRDAQGGVARLRAG